jgi:DNA-dependent RNA polymerase auxiliary subunit epsilon
MSEFDDYIQPVDFKLPDLGKEGQRLFDEAIKREYNAVHNTGVTIHKNPAGRNALTNLFTGVGCEIGTERGRYAQKIAVVSDKLFCIDLWRSYDNYRQHVTDSYYQEIFEDAKKRLSKYNVEFIRKDSLEAVLDFENESLDFVYLDANHSYQYIKGDLCLWYTKVKKGGVVSGHDFVKDREGFGVKRAVLEFCEAIPIEELTIWAGDKSPSWSFIKPN